MIKPRKTFHFNPPVEVKQNWMLGLVDLEVYNSNFNITEKNSKFDLYKFPDSKTGGISFEKGKDEIEKDLDISDNTAVDLQDDIIAPIIIEEYKERVTKRMKDGQFLKILSIYFRSVFQDFESFLRAPIDLIEDDFELVLDEYHSSFITYELQPGIYTFKDISEALFNTFLLEYRESSSEIVIEFDDITRKNKLVVNFGIIVMRFDEKSFLSTILGFTPGWYYKQFNKYISQKIVNLKGTNKIHLKCDCIDGSIQYGLRRPVRFSFVFDKPSGYKVFCVPETLYYEK